MAAVDSKYSPEEILQILNDFYNCKTAFDPEVNPGEVLTFDTTMHDWKIICDLVEPKPLAEYYHKLFKLDAPVIDLEKIVLYKDNKLGEFCNYIADHSIKQRVKPVVTMGQSCMTASIFKTLIANLKAHGVDTKDIKPSTKFEPLFYGDTAVAFLEEVNKLAPGALTKFEYEANRISRIGVKFNLLFLLLIILVPIIWRFHWILLMPLAIGISIQYIGGKYPPDKNIVGGYDAIRDLILGMETRMQN